MKREYHTNLAFLDVLFNTLLCFAALFAMSFILINPSKKDNNVVEKGEFVIVMTWPKEMDNDVDIYVEDPEGNLVAFMRREEGLMHLDRDDLGRRNDVVQTEFGEIEYDENREIVTLRGIMPGEYVINVHMYMKREESLLTPVTVQLDKINPYSTVMIKRVTLGVSGEEKTAFRFTLNNDGDVVEINELQKTLVQQQGPTL
tara:strand:- start:5480 stop:6082 length:603 start_codon:yes stop_codon:yes gene_type:complete